MEKCYFAGQQTGHKNRPSRLRNEGIKRYVLFLMLILISCDYENQASRKSPGKDPTIRLLLFNGRINPGFALAVMGPYSIMDLEGTKELFRGSYLSPTIVRHNDKCFILGNKSTGEKDIKVMTTHPNGAVIVGSSAYRGEIDFILEEGGTRVMVINKIPIEAYIAGALAKNISLDAPLGALEAQAIILRTQVLYELEHSKNPFFDISDPQIINSYGGVNSESNLSWDIVYRSRGTSMVYEGLFFKAFFHNSCGGGTSSAFDVFGDYNVTPLCGQLCRYCKALEENQWTFQITYHDLGTLLHKEVKGILPVKSDACGRVLALNIYYNKGFSVISAHKLRTLIGEEQLPSTLFQINPLDNGVAFIGRGKGHGVGLCQFGAQKMAEIGLSSEEILRYYYPGVEIYRFW